MNKDVLISILGMQFGPDSDGEKIEAFFDGTYYKKTDKNLHAKHYLTYEEIDDKGAVTKNLVKFDQKSVSIVKSGNVSVNMIFTEGEHTGASYVTSFGTFLMEFDTEAVDISEEDTEIGINIKYRLSINSEYAADCTIDMNIKNHP